MSVCLINSQQVEDRWQTEETPSTARGIGMAEGTQWAYVQQLPMALQDVAALHMRVN